MSSELRVESLIGEQNRIWSLKTLHFAFCTLHFFQEAMVGKQVSARKKSPDTALSRAKPTMTRALPGPGSVTTWPAAFWTKPQAVELGDGPAGAEADGRGLADGAEGGRTARRQTVKYNCDRRDGGAGADGQGPGAVGHEIAFLAGEVGHVVGILVGEQTVGSGE